MWQRLKNVPEILQAYRTKLTEKVKELLSDTQQREGRIATEVILYADKICTDEETVRLHSHIEHETDTANRKHRRENWTLAGK